MVRSFKNRLNSGNLTVPEKTWYYISVVKRSTVIIVLGFLSGLSVSILVIAFLQSRPLQDEVTVRRRQTELNQIIENRGAELSFGPAQTVSVDDEFTIPIVLDSKEFHVNSADISISYDPTLIEILSVENGTVFNQLVAEEILSEKQRVEFSLVMEPEKTFTGIDTIATLTARTLRSGTVTLAFIFKKNERKDSNVSVNDLPGEDVLETVEKVQITIQ